MWGSLKAGLSEFTEELSKEGAKAGALALKKLEEAEDFIEGGEEDEDEIYVAETYEDTEYDEDVRALLIEKDKDIQFWKQSFEALQQEQEQGAAEAEQVKTLKSMLRDKTAEVDTLISKVKTLQAQTDSKLDRGGGSDGADASEIEALRSALQAQHETSQTIHRKDLEMIYKLQSLLESVVTQRSAVQLTTNTKKPDL